jgi:hypothetical protein
MSDNFSVAGNPSLDALSNRVTLQPVLLGVSPSFPKEFLDMHMVRVEYATPVLGAEAHERSSS